jgi:hypothetical protein
VNLMPSTSHGLERDNLYKSPISDAMNVRFVENHIVIKRPVGIVYDWVTTWSNLPKWLPVALRVEVLKGQHDVPALLGDELLEQVNVSTPPKHYTVVARVPGLLWTVAGQDAPGGVPDGRISWVATFITQALEDRDTLFCRQFHSIRRQGDVSTERHAVENPQIIQSGLELIKHAIEAELARG